MSKILLLVGKAGVGKSLVSSILRTQNYAVETSFADPLKSFVYDIFGFTHNQLWGPSQFRDLVDSRFGTESYKTHVLERFDLGNFDYSLKYLLPDLNDEQFKRSKSVLREWVAELLTPGVYEGGVTPRDVLQVVGTRWGRAQHTNIWIDATISTIKEFAKSYTLVVVPDGRFLNEVKAIEALDGVVWKINAPITPNDSRTRTHISETEQDQIPLESIDYTIYNDKAQGLEFLQKEVGYASAVFLD